MTASPFFANPKIRRTDCIPNNVYKQFSARPQDMARKTERLCLQKTKGPEALKNLNFFKKNLKKGVDNGVQV